MTISSRKRLRLICPLLRLGAAAAIMATVGAADAQEFNAFQDFSAFHEIETKYIFGNFTVGSSTGIEGEKAFEPETEADFGKRGGRYAAIETELELEYTPTQYMQIEFGPTVSYYNIQNVPGLDNRNMGGVNGFEADFRFLLLDRGPSPFAVTVSIEPEFHSLDETSGAAVSNLRSGNQRLKPMPNSSRTGCFSASICSTSRKPRRQLARRLRSANRRWEYHRRSLSKSFPMSWSALTSGICAITRDRFQLLHRRCRLSRPDLLLADRAQGADERRLGGAGRRPRGRRHAGPRSDGFFPPARKVAA